MISPNGIRVILFDLDGTLRHNRPSSHQVLFTQAVQAGLKDAPEDVSGQPAGHIFIGPVRRFFRKIYWHQMVMKKSFGRIM